MISQPKPKRIRDAKYLAWIRTRPCIFLACPDGPPSEAHHVKPKGGGKMGSKPNDRRSVPVCRKHHELAEANPDSYRTWFERSAIPTLSQIYDETDRVAPRKTRTLQPVAKTINVVEIKHCPCGVRMHTVAISKTRNWSDSKGPLIYRCPVTNKEQEARLA